MNTKLIPYLVIAALLVTSVFLGVKVVGLQTELSQTRTALATQKTNEKVLDFTKMFTEKVLKADSAVDFETRLQLENAIRNLNDPEILAQWQLFVDSKNEADAQTNVKNLLGLLVSKIKV